MAKYQILIRKTAQKQLDKLPNQVAEDLIEVIIKLADNPRPPGYKKLKGHNAYRICKGRYRIIYEIRDQTLTIDVIALGHRKDVYR